MRIVNWARGEWTINRVILILLGLIIIAATFGCAVLTKVDKFVLGGHCVLRQSDRDDLCQRFKACGEFATVVIVGDDVCYTPDASKLGTKQYVFYCPNPEPIYHCDGEKHN